jgi:hypothetical protein
VASGNSNIFGGQSKTLLNCLLDRGADLLGSHEFDLFLLLRKIRAVTNPHRRGLDGPKELFALFEFLCSLAENAGVLKCTMDASSDTLNAGCVRAIRCAASSQ